ncbi:aspartic peptidase domain-containing protein [Suillus spraguei]|nr:aspartic peptidase domain-containing protein [Suillus spraguei]
MTRKSKFSNSTNLVQRDEARAAAFMDYRTHIRHAYVPIENDGYDYIVSVGIGDPPTTCKFIDVDSGSANTWVGAGTEYEPTDTSFNTEKRVGGTYDSGSGFFEGILWTDTFTLTDDFTITEMPIGVASEWSGIDDDDILGIGPTRLTLSTLREFPEETIPTVTDCLWKQGTIDQPLVGMFFQPATRDTNDDGELSFGEPNPAMYIGNIAYTHITTIPLPSRYWGIDQRITYGTTEILRSTVGIVDSGCTFLLIVSDAFDSYKAATGAEFDPETRLLTVTLEQYDALRPLVFHIGGETFGLSPNAQIWPRSLNSLVNGVDGAIYLVVKSLDTHFGSGLDFMNGYVFLERFYTVLDTRRSLVGFAKTLFTDVTTN